MSFYDTSSDGEKLHVDLVGFGKLGEGDVVTRFDADDFSLTVTIKEKLSLRLMFEQLECIKNNIV
jgi:hypothetical protein